jgi:hypothetical protein
MNRSRNPAGKTNPEVIAIAFVPPKPEYIGATNRVQYMLDIVLFSTNNKLS